MRVCAYARWPMEGTVCKCWLYWPSWKCVCAQQWHASSCADWKGFFCILHTPPPNTYWFFFQSCSFSTRIYTPLKRLECVSLKGWPPREVISQWLSLCLLTAPLFVQVSENLRYALASKRGSRLLQAAFYFWTLSIGRMFCEIYTALLPWQLITQPGTEPPSRY